MGSGVQEQTRKFPGGRCVKPPVLVAVYWCHKQASSEVGGGRGALFYWTLRTSLFFFVVLVLVLVCICKSQLFSQKSEIEQVHCHWYLASANGSYLPYSQSK